MRLENGIFQGNRQQKRILGSGKNHSMCLANGEELVWLVRVENLNKGTEGH